MTTLPPILNTLRNHCGSIMNAIAEYERLTLRQQWGLDASTKQERALRDIERRMMAACEAIGLLPAERRALVDQITRLQHDNARLTAANVRLGERTT